jgi:hypothetical protein
MGGQLAGPRKVLNCAIVSGFDHEIGGYGQDGVLNSAIISGKHSFIGTSSPGTGRTQECCLILGGATGQIGPSDNPRTNCCLLNPSNSQINTSANNSTVVGSNVLCTASGNFLYGDSAGGTVLTSAGNHRFDVRCSGGSTFYSNTTNTTGVSLGVGGGSWASVCDETKKENKHELNYKDISDKLKEIKIYEYNYIGNHKNIKCFGPMAQNWHRVFPCDEIIDVDADGNDICREAKDKLKIESGDMIGVCLATIKSLIKRVEALEKSVEALEKSLNNSTNHIDNNDNNDDNQSIFARRRKLNS